MDSRQERLHRLAVTEYRQGTNHRWVACLAACRIVGKYSRFATLDLASDMRISRTQVENLARAGVLYRTLRPKYPDIKEYRKVLTHTHFSVMGALAIKHDISPHEIVEQLRTAAENGASVEQMRSAIEGEHQDDDWMKFLVRARRACGQLWERQDTDEIVANAARAFLFETDGFAEELE